ncbi:hypothetical protein C8A03DRAFT_16409 [Achaetomium macrosporum]|uniref:Rhodopsin domain-containing protein n=1 Tax=Achaetomium macrosporum TaxID=79813 RepID=A0AAN7C8R5_9PEZI|nr:hypothetical protein C8A03DRAFT_16409 [Achaetomium macrosporum]
MEWADHGKRLFIWAVVMWALAAAAVMLRLISRGRILRVLGPTDWFIILTLLLSLINTIAIGFHVVHGLGHRIADLSWDEIRVFFQVVYGAVITNNLSLSLTKISVLLLFLDIFVLSWVRRVTYILIVLATLCGLFTLLSNILYCLPVSAFWDFTILDRRCIAVPFKYYVDAALNLTLDFAILFLPLPVIWPMTLPWRQKLWLYSVFVLGFFVCVISVLRFHFIDKSLLTSDPTYTGIYLIFWSMMEINVAIVIACIPTLKPLVARLCPRLLTTPRSCESDEPNELPQPPTISSPRRQPLSPEMQHL